MFEQHLLAQKCNWSLLRIFRVIVQERSLNQAAVKLCLTQSAVSQSLKRLEEQIGSTLHTPWRQVRTDTDGRNYF